jgi:hypothetical protein
MHHDPRLIIRNADGSTEGADPRRVGRTELEVAGYSGRPLLKVIREKCLDCCCYQPSEVAKCTAVKCALWPFRMGSNPFTNRMGQPEALLKKSPSMPSNSERGAPSKGNRRSAS